MRKVLVWIGPLVFAGLIVHFMLGFGSRWTWGRYGMPSTLLSAAGNTYLDGTPVDDISLNIVRSGFEEEIHLAAVSVLLALFAWLVFEMRKLYRLEKMQLRQMQLQYRLRRGEASPGSKE